MAGNFERMKAARLFAAELKATTVEVPKKGGDQYESQLYLTQTGAKAARVMVVGTATEIEDIGTDNNFYRMRVSDPTGVHFVTAGQYQPEAAKVMQELIQKLPAFVAVIGKVSLYNNGENTTLVSIRAEQVAIVDENVRDTWLLETAKATLDRLSALKANPELEQEVDSAYPTRENYKEIVKKVILSMKSDVGSSLPTSTPPPAALTANIPDASPSDKPMSEEDMRNFVEQQIITRNTKGQGVKIEALGNPCKGAGIKLIQLETAIQGLMNEGRIYEPKLGVVMPTGA
jgi:RPA family protein